MPRDVGYYTRLPWRVVIEPETQDDGSVRYVAAYPEFDGVLGAAETPEAALADLRAALRSAVEAMMAEGYPIPEPALART